MYDVRERLCKDAQWHMPQRTTCVFMASPGSMSRNTRTDLEDQVPEVGAMEGRLSRKELKHNDAKTVDVACRRKACVARRRWCHCFTLAGCSVVHVHLEG